MKNLADKDFDKAFEITWLTASDREVPPAGVDANGDVWIPVGLLGDEKAALRDPRWVDELLVTHNGHLFVRAAFLRRVYPEGAEYLDKTVTILKACL